MIVCIIIVHLFCLVFVYNILNKLVYVIDSGVFFYNDIRAALLKSFLFAPLIRKSKAILQNSAIYVYLQKNI